MPQQILFRRGTAADWTTAGTVVLGAGEPGFETDTGKFKIGDGTTQWSALGYATPTDISELADAGNLIPQDIGDLTDTDNLIPAALTDLGITDGTAGQVLTTNGAGNFTFTTVSGGGGGIALTDLSVTTDPASGGGALSYDNTTGEFTFVPAELPDLSGYLNNVSYNPLALVGDEVIKWNAGNSRWQASAEKPSFESVEVSLLTTNLEATLTLGTSTVTITNGTTANMFPGAAITQIGGTGAFVGGATVATVIDAQKFTVSGNHLTAGPVVFTVAQPSTRTAVSSSNFVLQTGPGMNIVGVANGVRLSTQPFFNSISVQQPANPQDTIYARAGSGDLLGSVIFRTDSPGSNVEITTETLSNTVSFRVASSPTFGGQVTANNGFSGNTFTATGDISIIPSGVVRVGNPNLAVDGNLYVSRNSYSALPGQGFTFAQHHETVTAVRPTIHRSRGTALAQTAVVNGDEVGGFAFTAHNGTTSRVAAAMAITVDGVPGTQVPGKITFYTNNGTNPAPAFEITSAAVIKANTFTNISGSDITFSPSGVVHLPTGSTVGGVPVGSINIAGSVANAAALPGTATIGDMYITLDDGHGHVWNGSSFDDIGQIAGIDGTDGLGFTGGSYNASTGVVTFTSTDGLGFATGDLRGADGAGVVAGGTAGQVLAKIDATNYNTEWVTPFDGAFGSLTGTPTTLAGYGITDAATSAQGALADSAVQPADLSGYALSSTVPTDLTDLGITDGTSGQVLTTDGSGTFTFTTVSSGGATTLDGLSDVNTAGAVTGSVLKYDGANWIVGTDDNSGSGGIALTDLSVGAEGTASGDGGMSYDNTTGVFTYTPPVIPAALTDLGITDGTSGQVLTTDGAGNFSFTTVSGGGGGLPTRAYINASTGTIADAASANIDFTGYKGYMLMAVDTTAAAWVRIYSSDAARTADAGRAEGTDPTPGAGVIAEIITTGSEQILITPGVLGFNMESPVTTTIPVTVTNKSGSSADITVTLAVLQLEG